MGCFKHVDYNYFHPLALNYLLSIKQCLQATKFLLHLKLKASQLLFPSEKKKTK